MEENFNPVAQTRANYYTPGSPVQFVCVELLKGDVSGEHAVCLTFKNISRVTLTALEIHFKCKGVDGVILCEDKFEYRDLQVKPGELFGQDDAVFITARPLPAWMLPCSMYTTASAWCIWTASSVCVCPHPAVWFRSCKRRWRPA